MQDPLSRVVRTLGLRSVGTPVVGDQDRAEIARDWTSNLERLTAEGANLQRRVAASPGTSSAVLPAAGAAATALDNLVAFYRIAAGPLPDADRAMLYGQIDEQWALLTGKGTSSGKSSPAKK